MAWDESYKLTWEDFKGKPNKMDGAVAVTSSGITFSYSTRRSNKKVVSFSTEVYAHFYPEQSWYKPERANVHILGHEQLHFDITELHARKFRKRIKLLKASNDVVKELNILHKTTNEDLAALQDKYDAETDFSRNYEAQVKWQIYIAKELKKLDAYKTNQ